MAVNPVKTPFTNMSFTPDVPSSALAATEYNSGLNIETNVRGVNSVAGDEYILSTIPGKIIYVTGGFRSGTIWYYVVATDAGKWYAIDDAGYTDVTPVAGFDGTGYNNATSITEAWNGTVLFINDQINPPMYLLPSDVPQGAHFRLYDHTYLDQNPNTYVWNYNTDWSKLTAGFMRLYSAPNVGSILIAGNLTADVISTGTTSHFPTTVRWSQSFGQNSGPTTWAPTLTNIANELEVPVRGPVIDGFPLNGNFYVCSYWDTVVFSPIAYTTTSAPVFGIKLLNQGRGLLNENCWANVDNTVYGVDARDIWSFDGGTFKPIGNQRVKDYFFANLNPNYTGQVFMEHNSSKYQIELYYPDLNSTGECNAMLAYRYDLDVWQPPRQLSNATMSTEGPVWTGTQFNLASRTMVYGQFKSNVALVQKDVGTSFLGNTIPTVFRRDNITFGQPYSAKVQVHRVLPEIYGTGNVEISVGGASSVAQAPTFKPTVEYEISTDNPWVQINQNDSRVVTLEVQSNSAVNSWQMTAANWQVTKVEDTR
jgi:hypothetical protein